MESGERAQAVLSFVGNSGTENISTHSHHLVKKTRGPPQISVFYYETRPHLCPQFEPLDSLKMESAWVCKAFPEGFSSFLHSFKSGALLTVLSQAQATCKWAMSGSSPGVESGRGGAGCRRLRTAGGEAFSCLLSSRRASPSAAGEPGRGEDLGPHTWDIIFL